MKLWLYGRQRIRPQGVETGWVTEPAGANPGPAIGVGHDVEDDVVGTREITGHSADTRQVVET